MYRLVDSLVKGITWIKRNKKICPKESVVKVNIGCGLTVAPGWINVDASINAFAAGFPGLFLKTLYKLSPIKNYYKEKEFVDILKNNKYIHHNVIYGIPLTDDSSDYIYSSHFLEHIFKSEAEKLIEDAYRVLKAGGVLRISIPNLENAINLYNDGKKEESLKYFFEHSPSSSFSYHRYMYDYDLLEKLLKEKGFSSVSRCECKKGMTPDIELLDNRAEQSLFVEAKK